MTTSVVERWRWSLYNKTAFMNKKWVCWSLIISYTPWPFPGKPSSDQAVLTAAMCSVKADSHITCCAHAVPLPCRAVKCLECAFPRLIYTVRPCLDSHLPCRAHAIPYHAVLLKATAQHDRRERACGLIARVRLLTAITRSSTKL